MPPDDLFPREFIPLADDEAALCIAAALRAGGSGRLSRPHECALAAIAAEVVADRLALAGVMLVRRAGPP